MLRVDSVEFNSFAIAHELKMFVREVDTMSVEEYYGWLEYFKIKNSDENIEAKSDEENEGEVMAFMRSKKG